MKKLNSLGSILSRQEMKQITGGDYGNGTVRCDVVCYSCSYQYYGTSDCATTCESAERLCDSCGGTHWVHCDGC